MHAYNDDHHDNALPLQAYRQLVRICSIKRKEATNHIAIYASILIAFSHENAFLTAQLLDVRMCITLEDPCHFF